MSGYGRSARNPIRVSGFYEEQRYLESLREAGSNAPLQYKRLGSCRSADTGHPVDVYRLGTSRLFRRPVLFYIDIYGERDWRAPAGYVLAGTPPEDGEGGEKRETADKLMGAIVRIAENTAETAPVFHFGRYHTLCRLLGHRFEGCVCNRCGFSRHEVDPKSESSEARCIKCGQTVPVERVTDATEPCPDCNGSGRVEAGFSNGYMIEEDCARCKGSGHAVTRWHAVPVGEETGAGGFVALLILAGIALLFILPFLRVFR